MRGFFRISNKKWCVPPTIQCAHPKKPVHTHTHRHPPPSPPLTPVAPLCPHTPISSPNQSRNADICSSADICSAFNADICSEQISADICAPPNSATPTPHYSYTGFRIFGFRIDLDLSPRAGRVPQSMPSLYRAKAGSAANALQVQVNWPDQM